MYIAGTNIPGFMPDNKPFECETFDEAKRYIISVIKAEEDDAGTEDEATMLCHYAEEVNLQSGEFSGLCLGKCYWVHFESNKPSWYKK